MTEERSVRPLNAETPILPPKPGEGAEAVDDHTVTPHPRGIDEQPTAELDPTVDDEHLSSPSQGVRPEPVPESERQTGS
jgi:hypothetical protein